MTMELLAGLFFLADLWLLWWVRRERRRRRRCERSHAHLLQVVRTTVRRPTGGRDAA